MDDIMEGKQKKTMKLENMKLYDGGRAPNPRRVQMFMQEKNIVIERIQVDIGKGEQRKDDFLNINPLGGLPVLELDDGTIIAETVAICRYLESLCPQPPLMGTGGKDTAIVEMWQRRVEIYFFNAVAQSFRHLNPAAVPLEGEQVLRWGEINRERALGFARFLNDELSGREFIAGERYTIADITALTAAQFFKPARITFPDEFEHFRRWFDKASARPGSALLS